MAASYGSKPRRASSRHGGIGVEDSVVGAMVDVIRSNRKTLPAVSEFLRDPRLKDQ